jgi:NifU-like protein involved in Fe-S cluster formation
MINQENLKEEGFDVTSNQAELIKAHYENPKNAKALKDYNARGIGRNPDNWGQVDMTLKIDNNGILEDLGYEYKGCPTISFTASVFTEELKGVSLEDGFKSTKSELETLMAQTNCDDCIKMILVAFLSAYDNYYERRSKTSTNKEDYTFNTIDTTIPYTTQSCG